MTRAVACLVTALALVACQGPQAATQPKAPTPQSVMLQPADVPGMQKCPTSGDVNTVLQDEKSEGSLAYQMNATEWQQWKRQGAVDAYFAVYGDTAADCAAVSSAGTGAPRGGLMVGLVVKFQSATVAYRNYRRDSTLMGMGPQDIRFIELAGGTTTFGTATGLGPVSVVGSGLVAGTKYFVAEWQNKSFESDFIGYDVAESDANKAVKSMNRRIS
ncbi:MAG TPA: hypothetical protein VLK30_09040 [Candidatus Limnocylindrales bacterium]|nr:hypothetical protein [Candidatus Limnocylindrales bacterium]